MRVAAQTSDAPLIRVNVRQVLVPVVVTDAKGRHVAGLKASDFRIEEDGVRQEIAAFSTDSAAAASALLAGPAAGDAASRAAANGPLRRTVVICLDALHTASPNSARTREALMRLFDKEKSAESQYVVLSIGRQLQVLQTATSDPAAVLAKLRGQAFQTVAGGGDAATFSSELSELKNRMYDFCRRCACGSAHACDTEAGTLKLSLEAQADHWAVVRDQFLLQLKSVVEELAKLPTARSLILVSDGFSLEPAREFYAVAASFLPKDSRFQLAGSTGLDARLRSVMQVAAEGNVRIDAIDSRGLAQPSFAASGSMDASTPADRSAPSVISHGASSNRGGTLLSDMDHQASSVALESGSGMSQLAQATGGTYLHDSNDLLKQFRAALADGREYYLLAYVPKNPGQDGKFRSITVEVSDSKLRVRAKSGYWAGNEDSGKGK